MNLPGVYKSFLDRWKDYQTVHIISDTHFGEKDLENAYSFRPKAEDFVKLINSKVGRKDILICLGDCGDLECWKKIHGYKVLIMGNHDDGVEKYRKVFQEVYEGPLMLGEKLLLSHEPILGINWALNIHGHDHQGPIRTDRYHFNINCDANKTYEPINFNAMLKKGITTHIIPLHRQIIDTATVRKRRKEACK
mgnify:FL=1